MPRKSGSKRSSWGQIDRRESGRYRARYLAPDTSELLSLGTFDLKGDAEAALAAVRVDIQRGKWKHPNAIQAETFKAYALAWIEQRLSSKGEHLRENTKAEYRRYLDKGLAGFADNRLSAITAGQIRAWHLERSNAGKTAAAREARLLRAVFETAVRDGIVDSNPVDTRLTKSSAGKKHRAPTADELAVMLETITSAAPRLRLALLLAAYGGLRLSEWRALRRRDLEFDGERYSVSVTRQAARSKANWSSWIIGPPKSAEGVRVVHLPATLAAEVTAHLENYVGQFPDSLLFEPAGDAEFLDDQAFNRHWNRARESAGTRRKVSGKGDKPRYENDITEHDLRAYAGTMYAQSGATLRETMAFLGHSTTEAAMTYQRTTGRAAELADRMPAPVTPASPVNLDEVRKAK